MKNVIINIFAPKNLACVMCLGLIVSCDAANDPLTTQNPERVRTIAALLPEEAGFPEQHVTNRVYWRRLASSDAAGQALAAARAEKSRQVQPPDDAVYEKFGAWTVPMQECSRRVGRLTMGEALSGTGEFLPAIIETLDVICSRRTWTGRFHDRECRCFKGEIKKIELGCGMISMRLAASLAILRPVLPPDVYARTVSAIREKCLDTYLGLARDIRVARSNSCGFVDSPYNWNAACNHYMVFSSLCVLDDRNERAEAIECAERLTKRYLDGFTDDGLCLEGASYWNYGFGNYMDIALVVRRATGNCLDFLPKGLDRNFLSQYGTSYCDRHCPTFGDCNVGVNSDVLFAGGILWPEHLHVAGKVGEGALLAPDKIIRFGDVLRNPEALFALAERPYVYPLRSWYPDKVAQLVCRPSTSATNSLYAAIQGSFNARPHGHHDVGTYCVAIDGVEVMGDLGNSQYTTNTFGKSRFKNPMRNSYGHPVPRVAGHVQDAGAEACGKVLAIQFSDVADRLTLDLSSAYASVSNLTELTRSFVYERGGEYVEVTDTVGFREPDVFETALTTKSPVEILQKGEYLFSEPETGHSLLCKVAVDGASWHFSCEELPETVGSQSDPRRRRKAYRAAIVFDEPTSRASVKIVWGKCKKEKQ